MIELYTQHHLVEDAGRTVSLDVAALVRDVKNACATAGIADAWLAEQMVLAIDDFFLARADAGLAGTPPARKELDRLVGRILLAAGYAEVAAAYLRGREPALVSEVTGSGDEALPWSPARVRTLLGARLPVPADMLDLLVRRVGNKLEDLDFRTVTDTLILELCGHLLRDRTLFHAAPGDSPWLLDPKYWVDTLSGESARLCRAGILAPHAVSRLLPTARLTLSLEALARRTDTPAGALTELLFFPELRQAARGARRVLLQMRETISEQVPMTAEMPVRLMVAGLRELLATHWIPISRADRRRLFGEIQGMVRETVETGLGCPLLLSLADEE